MPALSCKPWGDGSSPHGTTNVVCTEHSVIIAKDVFVEEANRLQDCWNACAGVPSDKLSTGFVANLIGTMQAGLEEARRRDELMGETRGALKKALTALDGRCKCEASSGCYDAIAREAARTVLAKMEEKP